ncbi:hypothetical protein Vafri_8436 [Volvox africanus]|nr:hypothetical protein Vafri_8436 [Volvox africanus]
MPAGKATCMIDDALFKASNSGLFSFQFRTPAYLISFAMAPRKSPLAAPGGNNSHRWCPSHRPPIHFMLRCLAILMALAASASTTVTQEPVISQLRRYNQALVWELDANGPNNVFLIWTTRRRTLDALAVACIGSAVQVYGKRVYLLANYLTKDDMERNGWSAATLVHYDPSDVVKDTPLYDWFQANAVRLSTGRFWFSHLTDMMRFALVYRHGGLYLDSDVLVIRPISPDKINKVVRSKADSSYFECAVVYFTAHHPYLYDVLVYITQTCNPNDWVSAGPKPLTDVYNELARRHVNYLPHQIDPGAWLGLRLKQAKKVFWPTGRVRVSDYRGCEVVHMWGSLARGYFRANTASNNFTYMTGPEKEQKVRQRLNVVRNVPYCDVNHSPPLPVAAAAVRGETLALFNTSMWSRRPGNR